MLSMQDLFTREEVDHFMDDCREKLGEGITFLVETKIDGLSMALRYEDGKIGHGHHPGGWQKFR